MPRKNQAVVGEAVTYKIPAPAGEVQLETFIPWTLVKRGVKREVITPLDAPQAFREEAAAERQCPEGVRGLRARPSARARALLANTSGFREGENAGRHRPVGSDEHRAGTRDPAADPLGPGYHRGDRRCPGTTLADVGIPVAKEHSAGLGRAAGACREPVVSISLVVSWCAICAPALNARGHTSTRETQGGLQMNGCHCAPAPCQGPARCGLAYRGSGGAGG